MPARWIRDAVRGSDAVRGPAEAFRRGEQRARHHPVLDYLGRTIDVGQERLQRADALHHAASTTSHSAAGISLGIRSSGKIQSSPPWEKVMPWSAKLRSRAAGPLGQVLDGERLQGVVQRPHVRVRPAVGGEHLVVGCPARISVQQPSHTLCVPPIRWGHTCHVDFVSDPAGGARRQPGGRADTRWHRDHETTADIGSELSSGRRLGSRANDLRVHADVVERTSDDRDDDRSCLRTVVSGSVEVPALPAAIAPMMSQMTMRTAPNEVPLPTGAS